MFQLHLQLHEEIIDTTIEERHSRQNNGPGIISELAVGIKSSGQKTLKIIVFLRGTKTNWLSLKIMNA